MVVFDFPLIDRIELIDLSCMEEPPITCIPKVGFLLFGCFLMSFS
jgi:hypothetical protein